MKTWSIYCPFCQWARSGLTDDPDALYLHARCKPCGRFVWACEGRPPIVLHSYTDCIACGGKHEKPLYALRREGLREFFVCPTSGREMMLGIDDSIHLQ